MSKFSKAIGDVAWSGFIEKLEYKLKWKGGFLHKIPRFYASSQICSNCGNKQKMPLKIRTHRCGCCGHHMDRDLNAAINIKTKGLEELNRAGLVRINACGDIHQIDENSTLEISMDILELNGSQISMKQEITEIISKF